MATHVALGPLAAQLQAAIGLCAAGDTAQMPSSPSSATWDSSGVSIAGSLYIKLDLNGWTVTRGTGTTTMFGFDTNSGGSTRITNGTIVSNSVSDILTINPNNLDPTNANPKWRLDHLAISGTTSGATPHELYGGWGVIDHCTFNFPGNSEMLHFNGAASNNTTSNAFWNLVVTPGSGNMIICEDCTFTNGDPTNVAFLGCSAMQSYYGAIFAFRYNALTYAQVDMHGTPGNVGARWGEFYGLTFTIPSGGTHNQSNVADIRGGSGVSFNNGMVNSVGNSGAGAWGFREEDTGAYPELWQPGRGKDSIFPPVTGADQALVPFYCWGSSYKTGPSSTTPTYCVDGRDFFSATQRPNYTPYQYPALGSYPVSATINAAGTTLTVVWPTTMTDGGAGKRDGFSFVPSGGAATLTYSSGTGTTTYVYAIGRTILAGESFATGLAYLQPGSGIQVPASGTIQDLTDVGSFPQNAGPGFTFNGASVTNNSTAGAGPTVSSASVNAAGTTLTVNWSASVTNGADLTGMQITIGGTDYTATYASGSGSTTTTYTVAKVWQTATVTNKYTQSGTGLVATSGGAQVQTYSAQAVTNNSTQALSAPTIGTATATGSSTITVTWTDTSSGAASFKIYRSLTNGSFVTSVGTAAIGATSFGDTGLSASTQYFYVVSAVVPGVESSQSASTNATTSGSGAPTTSGTQGNVVLMGAARLQ